MKGSSSSSSHSSPLEGHPPPSESRQSESRQSALAKLESGEYVLKLPKAGKSAVWNMFLNINTIFGVKVDFVLCRYCLGLFMHKGYASGTSSLMNHGLRCTERPKYLSEKQGETVMTEGWPISLESVPYFSLMEYKVLLASNGANGLLSSHVLESKVVRATKVPINHNNSDYQSHPASPLLHKVFRSKSGKANTTFNTPKYSTAGGRSASLVTPSTAPQKSILEQTIPAYLSALSLAANSLGVPIESLISMKEEVSDGAGSSSIGMSGIEAVVAAAAAAVVAAGDSDGGSGAALSGRHERQSPAAQGSSKPESYQLRHNNHLSLVLNQLAEDEAFMDVTLTAQGRNVKAHKSVLSAVSPYFSEVLKANPCQHPIVILPRDIRFSELNSIIMYIYRGEVTVAAEDLPSLLKTAELLNVTGLSPRDNNNSSDDNSTSKMTSSHGANNSSSISGGYTTTTTSTSHHHQSTSRSSTLKHSKQSNERSSERTTNSSSSMSGQSLGSPSHTLINPTDFMDLDMTCVKEEMQSGDEEEDPMESTTPKEVTTPPPIENPFLTSSKELSEASSSVTAFNSTDSSKADSGGTSSSGPNTPTTDNNSNAADNTRSDNQEFEQLEQNSLKTLASLASLNTPTSNLSPAPDNNSNSSSPALPASSLDEPSPNICPYCSLYFPTPELSTHLSSKHSFKAAFLCSDCARVYTRKNSFDQHSKSCSSKNNTS